MSKAHRTDDAAGSAERARVIDELAKEIRALAPGAYSRVAVDGVDGAGKTYLADELARALEGLGRAVVRVSVDGFHNPREIRYRRGRDDPEGFFRDSYDYRSLRSLVMEPFGAGGSGLYIPAIYTVAGERPVEPIVAQAPPGATLIVDGIFLHRDELHLHWDYSIWLEVPFEISVPRCAERESGFAHADPGHPSNRRYIEGQRLYMQECSPKQRATVVLDNSTLDAPVLHRSVTRT